MKINLMLPTLLFISSINSGQAQVNNQKYGFIDHISKAIEKDTSEWRYQSGAVNYSFVGDYRNSLASWDKAISKKDYKPSASDSLILASAYIQNAKDYILQRSKNEKILIINEAHHNPKHRTFTRSLLKELYNNGYRYLGLEAISDTAVNKRNYAIQSSGYYTAEPEFGNLIHEAKNLGFTIFGYEASTGKNGKEREIEQAKNIHEFMKLNNDGKYLIHCGFDHVYENAVKNWEKAMAGRLKEYSGIDPLTIDQVKLSEHSKASLNHYFLNSTREKEPFILKKTDDTLLNVLNEPRQTDIQIIHPPTEFKNERPTWISHDKKEYWIAKDRLKKYTYPVQIMAFRHLEYENEGIPADIIELKGYKTNKPLYLQSGKHMIVVRNDSYEVIDKFVIAE